MKALRVAAVVSLGVAASVGLAQTKSPTTRVKQGELAGSMSAESVYAFQGIPFAAPPVGELRWKAPAESKAWTGVRPATAFGNSCMQNLSRERLPWTKEFMVQNDDSEDCLYLNVWTPSLRATSKLPVVVFIHGGGFNEGSGGIAVYDGTSLAKKNVVVVTINYRVSIFGFFAHPALAAESPNHSAGNYGLLDQIAALKWVKENVQAFGGDPARVTIWGQSAGAMSVGVLIASPLAKGLFRGAIADSGISHSNAVSKTLEQAESDGEAFAKTKGAGSLADLRKMAAKDLMGSNVRFAPVVDGWVLPDTPGKLLESGPDADVPLITGYQEEDGRSLGRPVSTVQEYRQRVQSTYGEFAAELLKLYPVEQDKDATAAWEELGRDKNRASQYVFASKRSQTHKAPVYTYFFDRAIPWPQHPEFGAFHTGELPYLFANLDKLDRPWADKDRAVSRIASQYVVNFVSTGKPQGAGVPAWQPVGGTPQTMELGNGFEPMKLAGTPARQELWMKIMASELATKLPLI